MAEYHPGTAIEIMSNVPTSGFRCAIPNPKRYMRHNKVTIRDVCKAAYEGDYDGLEAFLSTGNEETLFNGDLNQHESRVTALHMAAMTGQADCLELLLQARADPHIKQRMPYGEDPEDGKTALQYAKDYCWDDCIEILEQAEKDAPYGWYIPCPENNAKQYNVDTPGTKPPKGFWSSRPGVAERWGLDPMKYGTGPWPPEAPEVSDLGREPVRKPAPKDFRDSKLRVALLFPGQGSQYLKMMHTVKSIPAVQEMLATADSILGYDMLEVCMTGPECKLEETKYCQPAVFIAGAAGIEKLRETNPEAVEGCAATAGLSLGEYTALYAAGVFTFADALKLVKVRGEAMDEAASRTPQAGIAVAGLQQSRLEELCQQVLKEEDSTAVCRISSYLFPNGFQCSGTAPAIDKLKDLAHEEGAMQVKRLSISGAFHTELMKPAAEKLGVALREVLPNMKPPKCPVYMNARAIPVDEKDHPEKIVDLLTQHLTNPVLWEESIQAMRKLGIDEWYEIGPMKQLKAMMKRIDTSIWNRVGNVEV